MRRRAVGGPCAFVVAYRDGGHSALRGLDPHPAHHCSHRGDRACLLSSDSAHDNSRHHRSRADNPDIWRNPGAYSSSALTSATFSCFLYIVIISSTAVASSGFLSSRILPVNLGKRSARP